MRTVGPGVSHWGFPAKAVVPFGCPRSARGAPWFPSLFVSLSLRCAAHAEVGLDVHTLLDQRRRTAVLCEVADAGCACTGAAQVVRHVERTRRGGVRTTAAAGA